MITAEYCSSLFLSTIELYHEQDDINNPTPISELNSIHDYLIHKSWIDTVQWHLEDIIRKPELDPQSFILIKRKIDASNQERTDIVEKIDDWFIDEFKSVEVRKDARLNTETPAWAIDRLSILMLKIYHMKEQTQRKDVEASHIQNCIQKLDILLSQKLDLSASLNELIDEISSGKTKMKVYRQMKMYNDPQTNPQLYSKK